MIKMLRTWVRKLIERMTGFDIERPDGNSVALVARDHGAEAWFSYPAQLRSVIERGDIDLVIDVGANTGQFARKVRTFYLGLILSFDPASAAFAELSAEAASDPRWQVHKLALGSQSGTLPMNVSNESVFSSLLKANEYCAAHFGAGKHVWTLENVPVRRLEEVLDELGPAIEGKRILLKMDTQGYDLEVFKGLGKRLRQVVALQSEVSLIPIYEGMPHWTESLLAYEHEGFGIVGLFPVNRERDSGRVIEYDCLMMKRSDGEKPLDS